MEIYAQPARIAIAAALKELQSKKGDSGMLVITNAGYGQINNDRTYPLIDIISELTGCSSGRRSLLGVLSSHTAPAWFSIRNDSDKTVFIKWETDNFVMQIFDASPATLLEYENWKNIADGMVGPRILNQIGSIGSLWSRDVPWYVLKGAELHGGGCPGNFAGYLVHRYLLQNLPLSRNDHYTFVFAPPTCGMDILQLIYASSAGQKLMFSMPFPPDKLSSYITGSVVTFATVIRVNPVKDCSHGVILGFDLNRVCRDARVDSASFFPVGLKANPLFGFARTKVAYFLAGLNRDQQLNYLSEIKKFAGKASLAQQITNSAGNPYKVIFSD
jgi:formylmethanofuran dehydrogenase subunit E-like metal-binding protein